jgi:hypothetical protein
MNNLKAQVKVFYSYILELLEVLTKLDDTNQIDTEEDYQSSSRQDYYSSGLEIEKIKRRYDRLRANLEKAYPDVFPDLMQFNGDEGVREFEELTREVSSVLKMIETFESENSPTFNPQDFLFEEETFPVNNTPFNENERLQIATQLDEVKAQIIKFASEQQNSIEELTESQRVIENKIDSLKESSSKIGRKDWTLQFFGVISSILITLGSSAEARSNLFSVIQTLLSIIQHSRLLSQ